VYFYSEELRLLTPDDAKHPKTWMDICRVRKSHVAFLESLGCIRHLPSDWEVIISMHDGPQVGFYSYSERQQFDLPKSEGRLIFFVGSYIYGLNVSIGMKSLSYSVEDNSKQGFWEHVKRFPMHRHALPPNAEVDFLSVLTYGASGTSLQQIF
jgi:hypothetical protein